MPERFRLNIVGLSLKNWNAIGTWSGTPLHFFLKLKKYVKVGSIINSRFLGNIKSRHLFYQKYKKDFILCAQAPIFEIPPQLTFALYIDTTKFEFFRELRVLSFFTPKLLRKIGKRQYRYAISEYRLMQNASIIFSFSDYLKRSIVADYSINPQKIVTVGAGPNLKRLPRITKKEYDGKTILFIGREFLRKGGIFLTQAFLKIKEEVPEAKLILVSDELKSHYGNRFLERDGIYIKGFTSKRELEFLYRKSSLFVLPTLFEPFGIVLLEAMAYKLPCIGSSVCAIPEIIEDGKTGFLVKPKDINGLSEKIIFLLKNKDIARHMGERGRVRVEQYYNWDAVAMRMAKNISVFVSKQKRHDMA